MEKRRALRGVRRSFLRLLRRGGRLVRLPAGYGLYGYGVGGFSAGWGYEVEGCGVRCFDAGSGFQGVLLCLRSLRSK